MEYCVFTEPHLGATYDDQLDYARAAEEHGFTGFFRSDHYLAGGDWDGLPGPTDAWITLAGLARETSTIRPTRTGPAADRRSRASAGRGSSRPLSGRRSNG